MCQSHQVIGGCDFCFQDGTWGPSKHVGLPNEGSICQSFEGRGNESLSFRVARNLIHLTSAWQREKTVTRATRTIHSQMGVFGPELRGTRPPLFRAVRKRAVWAS